MKLAIAATVIFSMFSLHAAEPRIQGRSMVTSQDGIVATEQPLASQVAVQILAEGGKREDFVGKSSSFRLKKFEL
jgi:hypothetical protein